MSRRVVVTGLGAVSPCGNNAPDTWDSMVEGRSGAGLISRFECSDWPVRIAAEVKDFDPVPLLGRKDARRMDRFTQFAVVASEEAVANSGLDLDATDRDRVAVYIGTGIGGIQETLTGYDGLLERGPKGVSAFYVPRLLTNMAGGMVALRLGARGPNVCVSTACATGTHSIGEAWKCIRYGEADVAISGGSEACIVPVGVSGFMVIKALSTRNSDPAAASRPFDGERDGFVLGEGAGVLVMESLEHAQARGAEILAEVLGYGLSCDAHHLTAPGGGGAERCMTMALQSANTNLDAVDYLNAHGTSTPQNDANETRAIHHVFGDHAKNLMVSSTKSVTGHLLGAAGGIEALATVEAIRNQIVPPTVNWENRDPECDLDYVPGAARQTRVDVALSNSFGFGGTNASLVFGRFKE
ncbi:MAG: beta-ketoacyl-ACP synthase II [Myxococcota bacterium]|nr:beta-ketoacyl-ACP synthase II [Myxococcota bacterium]